MPLSFNCPNCSAPLDVEGKGASYLRFNIAILCDHPGRAVRKKAWHNCNLAQPYVNQCSSPGQLQLNNEAVFIFSPDGRSTSRFGSEREAKGQFTSPRSISMDHLGRINIADLSGVMIYASDVRYLETLLVNSAVMGMGFDDQNKLYLGVDNQALRYMLK